MSKEDKIIHVEMNEEDVQNLVNCYEKDIKYIKKLEKELDKYKNTVDETIKILESKKHCERLLGGVERKTFTEQALDKLKELKGE